LLTEAELRALSLACDTIVPEVKDTRSAREFYARRATEIGVDKALADAIESKLEPGSRERYIRLLRIFDSRLYNLVLTGRPTKFSRLDDRGRADYLKGWRDSRVAAKNAGFQALKRLTCFLFYTVPDETGRNPNWEAIGYPGPRPPATRAHPASLRLHPAIIEQDAELSCDACVVGSGAGGSVVAYELARRGFDVVVVEGGGYETVETFDQDEARMTDRLFHQHGAASTEDLSFVLLSGSTAGGGTTVNWNTCLRPPSFVLEEWEKDCGIEGAAGEALARHIDEVWGVLKVGTSESQRNPNNDAIWRGCQRLGYAEGTDYEVISRNAVGCEERCGSCTYGCVYSCKQSTPMNYLPMAAANGARFVFNAKVDRVVLEGGVAKGVEATVSSLGKLHSLRIRSRAVVAACGAIETPSLLLRSGLREKNIGRGLRLHPTTAVSGVFDDEIRVWDGPPQTVAVRKFLDAEGSRHGFWIEAAPAHPGLWALSLPWHDGASHKRLMAERYRRSTATIVLVRDWGSGQVSIDKHGSARVAYRLNRRDERNLIRGMEQAARILSAAGASELWTLHSGGLSAKGEGGVMTERSLEGFAAGINAKGLKPNKVMLYSAHIMGSCPMSADAARGAVSPRGEVYGVGNLFVGDASVFPTAPGVNPMITIMAMAARTAGFVAERLKSRA
jgi:choline dehydrogenase-like flavoprotein